MAPVLGYWDIRGLCEPIRFLLNYVEQEFEDKRYSFGPPPDFCNDWDTRDKNSLGLLVPNLPYYIDGDVKLSQSNAIIRYLAEKHDLAPRGTAEKLEADQLEGHFYDFKMNLIRFGYYNPNWKEMMVRHNQRLPSKVSSLEKILSDGRSWFLGDRITYIDFLAYDALDFDRILKPDCLDTFPKVLAFLQRFENLPQIRRFMESGKYSKLPLFAPMASFGNQRE